MFCLSESCLFMFFQGCVVFLFSIGSWDANDVPFDAVMRAYIYLLGVLLENAENQVSGFVIVENFRDYSISQALSLRPSDLQKMVAMLQVDRPIPFYISSEYITMIKLIGPNIYSSLCTLTTDKIISIFKKKYLR